MKLLLFYSGLIFFALASIAVALRFPPRLRIRATYDQKRSAVVCNMRLVRAFLPNTRTTIRRICLDRGLVESAGASPPRGFRNEKREQVTSQNCSGNQQEVVLWKGRLLLTPRAEVEMLIPVERRVYEGKIVLEHEMIILVIIRSGSEEVPISAPD